MRTSNFNQFLPLYATEIAIVAESLSTITNFLPIDHGDRNRINENIAKLHEASARILEAAPTVEDEPSISEAEVQRIVSEAVGKLPPVMSESDIRRFLLEVEREKAAQENSSQG